MNAQQLKNSILQEAIEGRLVPQDPNDEPASVLLDKIRKDKARLVKEGKLKKKDLEETPISKDEIPFKIPESWEWVRLSYIFTFIDYRGNTPNKINSGIPLVTAKNVKRGYNDYSIKEYISKEEFELRKSRGISKKGDILFTTEAPLGNVSLADLEEFSAGQRLITFQAYSADNQVNKLLMLFMLSPSFMQSLIEKKTGTTVSGIKASKLKDIIIPLPPLDEQKRIVAKIEELLPKVEEYGKAQESLDKLNEELPERLKKSILQEAIEGRLVPQDPNDEPASVLLDKIRKEKAKLVKEGKLKKKDLVETPIEEDEIPFKIPESWEWCKFGNIVNTFTGKTPERGNTDYWCDEDYPWVSISDMKQGETITTTKERISSKAAEKCFSNQISPQGSLIMSFKLTVGRTSILGMDAYHNEAIITIRTLADSHNYLRNYLSYILPIITTWGDSKDAIKGKTLNSKSIYNLMVPLPPYNEQQRIVAKIEQLMKEVDKLKV